MTNKCLVSDCKRLAAEESTYRGLCLVCYGCAKKQVNQGKTTWDELVALGLATSINKDLFSEALDKARREQAKGVVRNH